MTIEYDLMRLTAQTSGPNPKEPGGGQPEYSVEELRACAAEMPHVAWHCLLAKYHQDELSERELLRLVQHWSLHEWFTNPEHQTKKIEAGQLNRVNELAVLCYLLPRIPHAENYSSRAAFSGCNHELWKRNFQSHFTFLMRELEYNEHIGKRAYRERKYGRNQDVA